MLSSPAGKAQLPEVRIRSCCRIYILSTAIQYYSIREEAI